MSSASKPNPVKYVPEDTRQNYLKFKKERGYVQKLPFWQRYYRPLCLSGGLLCFFIIVSKPLYCIFFLDPNKPIPERDRLWPGEIAAGKTYVEQLRERLEKKKMEEAAKEAAKKSTS